MEGIDKSQKSGFARWLPLILPGALIVVLLPVAIYIGFVNDEGRNESSQPGPSAVAATPQPDAVVVTNYAFTPSEITIRVGGTITFQNTSQTEHKISIGDLGEAATGGTAEGYSLQGGETFEWTAEEAGTFRLVCSLHENLMTGEVTVTE